MLRIGKSASRMGAPNNRGEFITFGFLSLLRVKVIVIVLVDFIHRLLMSTELFFALAFTKSFNDFTIRRIASLFSFTYSFCSSLLELHNISRKSMNFVSNFTESLGPPFYFLNFLNSFSNKVRSNCRVLPSISN